MALDSLAGTNTSFTHGLGAKPSAVAARLTCDSADLGYSAGDTVELGFGTAGNTDGGNGGGHAIRTDTTTVYIQFATGNIYRIPKNASTAGDTASIDNTKWSVQFFPYL
jgi:hypothetical protein